MYNTTIGLYHAFPANRSALIKELEHEEMNFRFEELTNYAKMKDAESSVIVIFSPEFAPSKMDSAEIKKILEELNKTLIIVTYKIADWTMNRNRVFYLQQRNDRHTINDVRTILAMVLTGRTKDTMLERSVE